MVFKAVSAFYRRSPVVANCVSGFAMFTAGDVLAQFIPQLTMLKSNNLSVQTLKDVYHKTPLDFKRSVLFGAFGAGMNGIALFYWYRLLEKVVGTSMKDVNVIFRKIVADQLIYAPFAIVAMFGFTSVMHGSHHALSSHHSNADCDAESVEMLAPVMATVILISDAVDETPDVSSDNSVTNTDSEVMAVGTHHQASSMWHEFMHKMEHFALSTWLADCMVWPGVSFINFRYIPSQYRPTFVGFVSIFWSSYVSYVSHKSKE